MQSPPAETVTKLILTASSALQNPRCLNQPCRPPTAAPLDRETLLARFDGIRQFARGGRRAPHKPLLLLYPRARLKHDRQTEIRFNSTEAIVNPLLRSYAPWGSGAHVSYPYGRLVNDGLWLLPDRAQLLDAKGNVREGVARERNAPAGFTPDVLATFELAPETHRRGGAPPARPSSRAGTTRRVPRSGRPRAGHPGRHPSSRHGISGGGARSLSCPSAASAASRCAW